MLDFYRPVSQHSLTLSLPLGDWIASMSGLPFPVAREAAASFAVQYHAYFAGRLHDVQESTWTSRVAEPGQAGPSLSRGARSTSVSEGARPIPECKRACRRATV